MPATFVTTADAVDRETAWLRTSGDGLPALLASDGGAWDLVEPYLLRTPARRKNRLYVMRPKFRIERFGAQRRIPRYSMELLAIWTLSSGSGDFQADQRAFDVALNDVVTRIGAFGPPHMDKTHGGAFMSVAEDPGDIDVDIVPYDMPTPGLELEAHITYGAVDPDFNG
jgi:hypothetical protein